MKYITKCFHFASQLRITPKQSVLEACDNQMEQWFYICWELPQFSNKKFKASLLALSSLYWQLQSYVETDAQIILK